MMHRMFLCDDLYSVFSLALCSARMSLQLMPLFLSFFTLLNRHLGSLYFISSSRLADVLLLQ
jgi:hypothetical protein